MVVQVLDDSQVNKYCLLAIFASDSAGLEEINDALISGEQNFANLCYLAVYDIEDLSDETSPARAYLNLCKRLQNLYNVEETVTDSFFRKISSYASMLYYKRFWKEILNGQYHLGMIPIINLSWDSLMSYPAMYGKL